MDIKKRRQHALIKTSLLGLILLIPIISVIYLKQKSSSNKSEMTYPVKPFFLQGERGSLTLHDLRGKISLVALIPKKTSPSDKDLSKILHQIEAWAKSQFKNSTQKSPPYQLITISEETASSSSNWIPFILGSKFREEVNAFLGHTDLLTETFFLLIDENANVRTKFAAEEKTWDHTKSTWSKLIFNLYLQDYLSKRTFFGPKKESSLKN